MATRDENHVDGTHSRRIGVSDAHLTGNEEEREGHADGDEGSAEYVRPNELDPMLTGLDHHENSTGEEEKQNVDGERPRCGRHLGVVQEIDQESAGVVEVRGVLAPSRDQRCDCDGGVDSTEDLAGCGHDRCAFGCTHFGTLKRQVSGIDTFLLPVWQMVNVG